jgi:hypothetical protein
VGARVCALQRLFAKHRSYGWGIEPRPLLTHPLPLPCREGKYMAMPSGSEKLREEALDFRRQVPMTR